MESLFGSLKGFFKRPPVIIDNFVFRIHYRATFVVLIAFSLMVTSKQYFGDPIDCISKDDVPSKMLDTYCWIHTTFSIENAWKKRVGDEVPYPGVDKTTDSEKRVYHAYYQWVCFVLFFQALFFYVPRFLWKTWEGGLVAKLTKNLTSPVHTDDDKIQKVVGYLKYTRSYNNTYYYCYTFTEILNFINVIVQMFMMNKFLGGTFTYYGWEVLNFTEWDWTVRYDPMIKVFPRLTKCNFHRYGPSGDVMKYDSMCILPINIVNEKIYVFLWFWFYAIAIISALAVIYRIMTFFNPNLRVSSTASSARGIDKDYLNRMLSNLKVGDWFLIHLCSQNMDPVNFREVLHALEEKDAKKLNGSNIA